MASQAEVDLIVNATRTLPDLERDLDRVLRAAQADMSDLDVDVVLNQTAALNQLDRDLDRVIAAAQAGADDIDLDAALNQQASIRTVRNQLDRLVTAVNADTNIPPALVTAALNGPASLAQIRHDLNAVVRTAQATAPDIDIDVDVDRNLTRNLLAAAGGVGALTATVTRLSAALGAAAPLLAGVATSVQNIVPASAVATQGILAMVLATNTLKLGLIGVSDTISKAFDPEAKPEDLAKEMERLAPEARRFVRELIGMKDELKNLQLGVQNRLFKDLDEVVSGLASTVLPQVRTALNATATTLNQMGVSASLAAARLSRDGTLGKALDSATTGIRNLADVPALAVTAFGQLAAAAGPSFDRITKALGRLAEDASKKLSEAFESGALQDSIEDAIDAVRQLGRVFGNVFAGIGNIIGAVSVGGDGLFSTLEKVSQAFEDLTANEDVQDGLRALADTASLLSQTALPLIADAIGIVARVLVELQEPVQQVIEVLGDALSGVLEALGPVLETAGEAFGNFIVALSPLITLAGELISAILPALNPLLSGLSDIFRAATPFIQEAATVLSSLFLPVLQQLPGIIELFLPLFTQFAEEILPVMADELERAAPIFADLGKSLAELAVQLAPLIAQFLSLFTDALSVITPYIGGVLVGTLAVLAGSLSGLVDIINKYVIPAFKVFSDVLSGDVFDSTTSTGKAVSDFASQARTNISNFVTGAVDRFNHYTTAARTKFEEARTAALNAVSDMVNDVLGYLSDLPGRARSALGDLGSVLFSAGSDLIGGLIDGVESKLGSLRSTLGNVTNLIPDWKGPAVVDAKLLTPNGELIIQGLIDGFRNAIPRVRDELSGLTRDIPGLATPSPVGAPLSYAVGAPTVYVTIGNEAVDQYVTTRVVQERADERRLTAQGVRI